MEFVIAQRDLFELELVYQERIDGVAHLNNNQYQSIRPYLIIVTSDYAQDGL